MALSDDKLWHLWNAQGTDDMSREEAFVFARVIEAEARRDALEEAAREFDRRSVLLDGGPAVGWYEPNEPAEIIRKLKEDIQ